MLMFGAWLKKMYGCLSPTHKDSNSISLLWDLDISILFKKLPGEIICAAGRQALG